MRKGKIGLWAGSLSIRLTEEFKSLGLKETDVVSVSVEKDKIVIEKVK